MNMFNIKSDALCQVVGWHRGFPATELTPTNRMSKFGNVFAENYLSREPGVNSRLEKQSSGLASFQPSDRPSEFFSIIIIIELIIAAAISWDGSKATRSILLGKASAP